MALRIKDNVDLKELEKYGFNKEYYFDEWCYVKEYRVNYYQEKLIVWKDTREIQAECSILLGTLYDMIQDGIIEKSECFLEKK